MIVINVYLLTKNIYIRILYLSISKVWDLYSYMSIIKLSNYIEQTPIDLVAGSSRPIEKIHLK